MIKCIIIDDEAKARKLLHAIIEQYCSNLQIEAECEDLPGGVKAIKKYKPSLVFLDIEMPGYSGLELLNFFEPEEVDFEIVFTTAYNEYALQAFRFSAIDYLLKPIQHTQLIEAVERFTKRQRITAPSQQLELLTENLSINKNWADKKIVIPSGQSLHFFQPNEIIMIKAEAAYSEIYLLNGKKLLASRNLKHFEDMLHTIPIFFRSHKSYIVNLNHVITYNKSDGGSLQMVNGHTAGISSERNEELIKRIS
jgi:two-component system, LytTR family, response regulator